MSYNSQFSPQSPVVYSPPNLGLPKSRSGSNNRQRGFCHTISLFADDYLEILQQVGAGSIPELIRTRSLATQIVPMIDPGLSFDLAQFARELAGWLRGQKRINHDIMFSGLSDAIDKLQMQALLPETPRYGGYDKQTGFAHRFCVRLSSVEEDHVQRQAALAGFKASIFMRHAGLGRQILAKTDYECQTTLCRLAGLLRWAASNGVAKGVERHVQGVATAEITDQLLNLVKRLDRVTLAIYGVGVRS